MTYKSALDPENDPVVYTTDYGLEIRYANAFTNSNLAGYTYFTMGEYGGTPVNWVIIGYDPSMHDYVQDVSGEAFRDNPIQGGDRYTQFGTLDNSAAGTAIMRDSFAISNKAQTNFEIGEGCVLCFSEFSLYSATFNNSKSSSSYSNYVGSNLQAQMTTLYNTSLNFSDAEKGRIIPQSLITANTTSQTTPCENQNLFALATAHFHDNTFLSSNTFYMSQSFRIENYLGAPSTVWGDNTVCWYTRTGFIGTNNNPGALGYFSQINKLDGPTVTNTYGVRPAFVMNLL